MKFSLSVKWTAGEVSVYRAKSLCVESPLFKKQLRQAYFTSLSAPPHCLLHDDWLWEYSSVFLRYLCCPCFSSRDWRNVVAAVTDDSPLISTPLGSFPCHRLGCPKSQSLPLFSQACPPLRLTLHLISFLEVAQWFGSLDRVELECRDAASGCATDAVCVCETLSTVLC